MTIAPSTSTTRHPHPPEQYSTSPWEVRCRCADNDAVARHRGLRRDRTPGP
ncbi:hypothetical protein [Streptomyces sp. NPDC058953]|uniref:hypothetical protein n=1 Tax=Streptomyces sp. NPDC058953 TaxID=3346676 RepID=UPI00369B13CD